jgi:hypothetical protein
MRIEPSDVAALAYDLETDDWFVRSCTGDVDADTGVDTLLPALARYKRVWVWEGQPVVYRIAAVCHLEGLISDENAELTLTKPGFTTFKYPARLYAKGARYKTTVRSLRDYVSAPPQTPPAGLDDETEWVCGILDGTHLDIVDAFAPMAIAQAEFSDYVKDEIGEHPSLFGTDFKSPLDGVSGLCGVLRDVGDVEGVDVWDVSSLYPAIASCMPLPTGSGVYDYSADTLSDLPDDCLWIANVTLPDGMSQWVTSVDYRHTYSETLYHTYSDALKVKDADVQVAIIFDSVSGLYKKCVDAWYRDKKNSESIVKDFYKKKMNSFFGSLAMRHYKRKEKAVYRDGYGFDVETVGYTVHETGSLFLHQVFIVAYGRAILTEALRRYEGHVVYYDTDSIHLIGVRPSDVRLDGVPVGDRDDDLGQWTLRERNATVRYLGLRRYAIVEWYETTDGETTTTEEYANLHLAGYRAPSFLQAGRCDRILLRDLDEHSHLPSLTYEPGPDSLVPVYTPYRIRQTVYLDDVPAKAHGEWSVHADAAAYEEDPRAEMEFRLAAANRAHLPVIKESVKARRLALAPLLATSITE